MDDDDRARLAAIPWFASLESAVFETLASRGRWRRLAAGEWLHGEGDEETGVVAVTDGALHLHVQAPGAREVLVSVLPAGGVIGQSALFGGGPRLVTAVSAADTRLFVLSDQVLRQAAAQHASLWPSLSALVYEQLRIALRALAEFAGLKPRARMISRLAALASRANPVLISQAALAEMVGVSRNAVNGWLGELEALRLVERGYGWIRIVEVGRLRRLADA